MVVEINCGNYDIVLGKNALSELVNNISATGFTKSDIYILADLNTIKYCLPDISSELVIDKSNTLVVEPGELTKSLETVNDLIYKLSDEGAHRNSILICLGGGMITDLGAFVASIFKRGIDCIHVPTSLLGMVDASIGGKSGVDVLGIKNLAGTFFSPNAVFTYPDFLNTLPDEEWINGLAEVIKHALIGSTEMWEMIRSAKMNGKLTENHKQLIKSLVPDAIKIKSGYVKTDPYDKRERMALNFGHTIGHSIETTFIDSHNKLSHGRSIAAGMICELFLAWKIAGLEEGERDQIVGVIKDIYGISAFIKENKDQILTNIKHDKKRTSEGLVVTLINGVGEPKLDSVVDLQLIDESLNYYLELE